MKFQIKTEYITLQQLLKAANILSSGGEIKAYIQSEKILVNNEPENRRGRKLYPKDVVETNGVRIEIE